MDKASEIQQLEQFVADYRDKKRERNLIIDELNSSLNRQKVIKNRLITVEQLVKGRDVLKNKVDSYSSGLGMTTEQIQNLKLQNQIKYIQKIANPSNTAPVPYLQSRYIEVDTGLHAKSILVLPLFQVIFTLIMYFLSKDIKVISIGLVSLVLYLIFFTLINLLKDSVLEEVRYEIQHAVEEPQVKDETSEVFIKKAWLGAMQKELSDVELTISSALKGEKYEDLIIEQESIKNKIDGLQEKLEGFAIPSPDEYLKKRRKLDLLKIDGKSSDDSNIKVSQ